MSLLLFCWCESVSNVVSFSRHTHELRLLMLLATNACGCVWAPVFMLWVSISDLPLVYFCMQSSYSKHFEMRYQKCLFLAMGENRSAEQLDTNSVHKREKMLTFGVIFIKVGSRDSLQTHLNIRCPCTILSGLIIVDIKPFKTVYTRAWLTQISMMVGVVPERRNRQCRQIATFSSWPSSCNLTWAAVRHFFASPHLPHIKDRLCIQWAEWNRKQEILRN